MNFKEWIETLEGKSALSLDNGVNVGLLRNRLWHAFHAGLNSANKDEVLDNRKVIHAAHEKISVLKKQLEDLRKEHNNLIEKHTGIDPAKFDELEGLISPTGY